jgi:nascent polypeptide-associated complex subunit alpha
MMQNMGMKVETLPNVIQVIIRAQDRELIIDGPEVTLTRIQGQEIYQVVGGSVMERKTEEKKAVFSDEDVQVVAQQASATLEEARKALEETGGDLAQAILLLIQREK